MFFRTVNILLVNILLILTTAPMLCLYYKVGAIAFQTYRVETHGRRDTHQRIKDLVDLFRQDEGRVLGSGQREQREKYHYEPEVYMDVSTLITSKGYQCETHEVTTDDGFILTIQRIPQGISVNALNRRKCGKPRPVVFLQHGLLGGSSNWLTNPSNESLAYILADAGADVWLGNMRGTNDSKRHVALSPLDRAFWNWTFDDMAQHDLPAMINYVLKMTNNTRLYYVGHSQGAGTAVIQWARDKKLASKIHHFFALSPATRLKYTKRFHKAAELRNEIALALYLLDHGSTNVDMRVNLVAFQLICETKGYEYCRDIIFTGFGSNPDSFNTSRLPVYLSHCPQPTSAKNLLHWAQNLISGKYRNFDMGSPELNMKRYGQKTPPEYDLRNFDVPTTVFYGGTDALVDSRDVLWLAKQIRAQHVKEISKFIHVDFIWGIDARHLVYTDIVQQIFHGKSDGGKTVELE